MSQTVFILKVPLVPSIPLITPHQPSAPGNLLRASTYLSYLPKPYAVPKTTNAPQMATTIITAPQHPNTFTYIQYTVTTITASPIPSLAATLTVGMSGQANGTKTTTSEILTCTPSCIQLDSEGRCIQMQGCELKSLRPEGFVQHGEVTKKSAAGRLWRDPGARMAVAVLGVSWVVGAAMLSVF
ncbi:hypothetical protein M409DRAFT_22737 [Zasmidium cellare ATCC 36951]|uniref:Uncharacterized protein n=1 Tax=Zasmidium cellare ATCC 36951 TaxID=1080233 RepID=A0A6A6CMC7_ZASCE|nr:uncharacterized protein M409DRAFT_22737 [Zasmidium cellare ATCC 36951]KAF2167310.1 hypothetical protein M409DRAFT_22737 [Zasmidium cellare ATCC 36951]